MNRVKVGDIELQVEALAFVSPQKVAWIRMPARRDIAQDWGEGLLAFSVRGWFPLERGQSGVHELRGVKAARKPVTLQIDENAWQVQCGDFRFTEVDGTWEFELDLTEVVAPETLVFTLSLETREADVSQRLITLLRLEAQAFWWLGIADRVSGWITEAEVALLQIIDVAGDFARLAELPWDVVGQVRQAAAAVVARMASLIAECETQFETETRGYTEGEESMKRALLLARQIRSRMAGVVAACDAMPHQEQKVAVEEGDTLVTVAARVSRSLGRTVEWTELALVNAIDDPGDITVGQQLVIPS